MKTTAVVIFFGASVLFRAAVDLTLHEVKVYQSAEIGSGPQ